jgi:hypothetical protein
LAIVKKLYSRELKNTANDKKLFQDSVAQPYPAQKNNIYKHIWTRRRHGRSHIDTALGAK